MADDPTPNPNPGLITDASWRFMLALLALEPGTQNAGIYANKAHYHNTRKANLANWPGSYSVQHPLDLLGPDDKAAAYDWTHVAAHGGDYRSMRKYGDRLYAAWKAHDPRLYGWREVQGMISGSSLPVDLNFAADDWRQGGTPALSHMWHKHFSEHRAFVALWDNKLAMLSILRGQSLADYLAAGGKLMGDNDMTPEQAAQLGAIYHVLVPDPPKRVQGAWSYTRPDGRTVPINPLYAAIDTVLEAVEKVGAAAGADPAELAAIREAARQGAEVGVVGAADELVDAFVAALPDDVASREDVVSALREVLLTGVGA